MADKAEKKPEAPAAGAAEKKDAGHSKPAGGGGIAGLLGKTPVLIGVVMIIEAIIIFAGVKMLGGGGPQTAIGAELEEPAHGEAGAHGEGDHGDGGHGEGAPIDRKKPVEVLVLEFRAPNKMSGRTFIYDVAIYAVTKGEFAEQVKTAVKDREASIKDRIRTIIAQSDPDKLGGGSEPGLETLRRQVKHQLDELIGEKMIDEVLVPRCIPFRADF